MATLIPIGALSWLGVRIIQQDRDVERQRRRERLEVAAGRLALNIERRLQDLEEQLVRGADGNTAAIHFLPVGLKSSPGWPLLYQPELSAGQEVSPSFLAGAEAEEFQRHDLAAAAARYRHLAESRKPTERAAALIGLGRVLRQRGDRSGALQVYADLEQLGSVVVAGQPVGLVARQGRCKTLEEAGDAEALRREAADLARVLNAGGWQIDRATFELYRDLLQHWGGPLPSAGAIARTEAATRLWRAWRARDLPPRGRRIFREDGGPMLAVWARGPERPVAWLATSGELEASLRPLWTAQDLAVSLYDTDGQPLFGDQRLGSVTLTPSDTRLPFILSVASLSTPDAESDRMRRTVFIGGLLVTMLLMLAAAYGLYRATTRELVVARQQSDFVSAVSHEFRTPLTSMRHLTD
ncbi:MAG: hypothetical protein HYZ58_16375, partial [Acidobacteria bacterium]|nr:hypothetical protein [Acidobacteriota bacterium]